ncbi:Alcohol dehydrogenase 1 [Colletotrichum siamense]|uniref:Alcohol dehydrogenase 1 n=1 Tax=Colletotrichum siamense TaxID=690259 RepID=A0A9P5ETI9_COLSI|nr:Alcohol dehydrogenase 1 [Colletotrichum siamense]KAF4859031.1 Alcohol dehydrogenase 1 [Colletotrichum siamense]
MARNVFKAKVIGIDLAWKAEALGSRAADTFDEFIAAPDQATDWDEFQRSISDACQRLRNAKEARRNADYLVVTSGCETAFEGLIDYVCDGGSVICVGVPKSRGNLTIPLALMVERSIRFQGLLMGGWDESYEVMEYIREGKLRPLVVEVCLEEVPFRVKAFKDHHNIGKVVVRMDDSI